MEVLPLPVPNPWQQLDTKQVRESEDRIALALRIGVDRVRLHVGLILPQKIENGVAFPRAACRPAAHQCDRSYQPPGSSRHLRTLHIEGGIPT